MSENISFIEPQPSHARQIATLIASIRRQSYSLEPGTVAFDTLYNRQRSKAGIKEIEALITDPEGLHLIAVAPGDTLAGVVLGHHSNDVSVIDHNFVNPFYRRRGISGCFLDRSYEWAPGDEVLYTPLRNDPAAIRLYERHGFQEEFTYGEVDLQLDFAKMRRTKEEATV